ncbi:MAG: type II secretion system F family protein [Proteobacteria bacterium]|nr:type II secretion system F family protein [Pseudomonadota bacterium]
MDYIYKAITPSGQEISGVIIAQTRMDAEDQINGLGYIPLKVKEKPPGKTQMSFSGLSEMMTPVSTEDLILFTKQFRTMLKSGVNIIQILDILFEQSENVKLKKTIGMIRKDLNEGKTIHQAFSKHQNVFPPLYCSMLEAGEVSGSLPDILERLIYIIDHENKIKSDIKSALRYPAIVVVTLFAAFLILLTFVIPKFVTIFNKAGLALPLPTKICLWLYNGLHDYWYVILAGIIFCVMGFVMSMKTPKGRFVRDTAILSIPIIGPLLIKSVMARFASVFSILLTSGVAILSSLDVLSKTLGNAAITRQFNEISEKLEEGQGIAKPLRSARYFPPMVINMVAIGEEAGTLDEMLKEVAIHYDDEVEYAVKGLSEAIGPILTIGLAAVVGFFALAIFLPMWDLTKMVK